MWTNHDTLMANCLASHEEIYRLKEQEVNKGIVCKFFPLNQYRSLRMMRESVSS